MTKTKKIIVISLVSVLLVVGGVVAGIFIWLNNIPDAPAVVAEVPDDIPDDPADLPEQDFASAWDAVNFATNRFENEEDAYVTSLLGTATPSIGGTQSIYSVKYKSNVTDNFYYATYNYGENVAGIDPSMAAKIIKEDNSADEIKFALVKKKHSEQNTSGVKVVNGVLSANFTDITYETYTHEELAGHVGSDPTKLWAYIINEDTVDAQSIEFEKLEDGSYVVKFSLKEAAVADYKKQVNLYSGYTYESFVSVSLELKIDKYGRAKELKCTDSYKINAMVLVDTVSVTTESFYYGLNPSIVFNNGNPEIEFVTSEEEPTEFKLNFEGGGEFEAKDVTLHMPVGELPDVITDDDHDFLGWFTEENGCGIKYETTTIFDTTENLTLYAHILLNKYSVYFMNGEVEVSKLENVPLNTAAFFLPSPMYSTPAIAVPTGYHLLGWYSSGEYAKLIDGQAAAPLSLMTTPLIEDYGDSVFYAVILYKTYKLDFYDAFNDAIVDTRVFTVGASAGELPVLSHDGYTFLGFFTEPEGGTKVTSLNFANNVYSNFGDKILYAQWKVNDSVITYCDEESSVTFDTYAGAEVASFTATDCGFEKSGYTLIGWSETEGSDEIKYASGKSFTVAASEILYAVWAQNCTIIFYNHLGDEVKIVNTYMGAVAVFNSNYTGVRPPSGSGLSNYGYSTTLGGTIEYDTKTSYTIDGSLELYAIMGYWIDYYSYAGAPETHIADEIYYDERLSYTILDASDEKLNFAREGYTFGGWETTIAGERVEYVPGESYEISESLVLNAIWIPDNDEGQE